MIDPTRIARAARRLMQNRANLYRVSEKGDTAGGIDRSDQATLALNEPCTIQTVGEDRVTIAERRGQTLTHTVYFARDVKLRTGWLIEQIGGTGPRFLVQDYYDASAGIGAVFAADCQQRT